MAYDLKHTGEAVDAAVSAVESGSVVTDNTVSSIAPGEAKPASADAIAKELQKKVDKIEGKELSTNDYTNEEMAQVERVRDGSVVEENTLSEFDETSDKPVNSKAVTAYTGRVAMRVVNGVTDIYWRYSTEKDIMMRLSRVGANGVFQIEGIGYSTNAASSLVIKDAEIYKKSGSDWLSPYEVKADNRDGSYNGFTGGMHGSSGGATGAPTAETESVNIFVDNRKVDDGYYFGDHIRIVVVNKIQAGNTKNSEGTGDAVLHEFVTYTFDGESVNVAVKIEALEDITIGTYYGLQVNGFSNSIEYFGEKVVVDTLFSSQSDDNKLSFIICGDNGGNYCRAQLNQVGLASRSAGLRKYAFTSGAKAYYNIVDKQSTLSLKANEIVYISGSWMFSNDKNALCLQAFGARENKDSGVMLAKIRESHASMLSKALLGLNIEGLSPDRKLIVSKFAALTYNGKYIPITIADITDGAVIPILSFSYSYADLEMKEIKVLKPNTVSSLDIYNASLAIDLSAIGDGYFEGFTISTIDEDTYNTYGINPIISKSNVFKSALVGNKIYGRLKKAILEVGVKDVDDTRNYVLKRASFDRTTRIFTLVLSTTENAITAYGFSKVVNEGEDIGIRRIYNEDKTMYVEVDFSIFDSVFNASQTASSYDYSEYGVEVRNYDGSPSLFAEEEMSLTMDGIPMKLLDCGKNSGIFYMSSGTKVYSAHSITKSAYSIGDVGGSIKLVCDLANAEVPDSYGRDYCADVNALRELNNGNLLINANIVCPAKADSPNYKTRSIYYIYNGDSLVVAFQGSWGYYTFGDGIAKSGGYWTNIWDFDECEDIVLVSERAPQGLGGRAWMSKDGGNTWFVIFNAFTYSNGEIYSVVQPSGWDNTIPEKPDFTRPVSGLGSSSNFHIHGIAYDKYRDRVIIVSGDATWEKGSYTAVWVLDNPLACEVYDGATTSSVEMLRCNWRRIGLYRDEVTSIAKDLQFVSILPFPSLICFGSDAGGGGINGVICNTSPSTLSPSDFKVEYPLNSDSENALTHCAGGVLRLPNLPILWTFHREGSGFNANSSDQRAAILSSYDGKMWKRVWVDDTLDADRNSKITWGATLVGKASEMYLRYGGFSTKDNVIRRMKLR